MRLKLTVAMMHHVLWMVVGQIGRPGIPVRTRAATGLVSEHVLAATQYLNMAGITVMDIPTIPNLAIMDLVLNGLPGGVGACAVFRVVWGRRHGDEIVPSQQRQTEIVPVPEIAGNLGHVMLGAALLTVDGLLG